MLSFFLFFFAEALFRQARPDPGVEKVPLSCVCGSSGAVLSEVSLPNLMQHGG
jgi:hypothetical protein